MCSIRIKNEKTFYIDFSFKNFISQTQKNSPAEKQEQDQQFSFDKM